MHLLMIEDDTSITEMMTMFFDQRDNWHTTAIGDGEEGWQYYLAHEDDIEMIILDLNLPNKDGKAICRDIRSRNQTVPIIMLTARDSESDQVLGFDLGADDYVTKPFSPIALVARIEALNRRYRAQMGAIGDHLVQEEKAESQGVIQTAHITINARTREVQYDGQAVRNLTPKEFDILALLVQHPKQVFTRERLLECLWEAPFVGDERTVDAHIKKLRHKLEAFGPQVIQTVWGVGYKFDENREG